MHGWLAGIAGAAVVAATLQTGGAPPADAAAVRDVVAKYVAAREARDAGAVRALFTPDADQLTSSGEWRRGREEVVTGSLASSERTGGHRELTVEALRFLGTDAAIADCRYVIAGAAGGDRRMWSTFVLARADGGWRIEAIRNMLPAAPVPAR